MQSRLGRALIVIAFLLIPACGSDDGPTGPGAGDTVAPAAISSLSVLSYDESTARIVWSAPGDDGMTGTATAYEIRYAAETITPQSWLNCSLLDGCPTPEAAGTEQWMDIASPPTPNLFVALRAVDEAGNWSDLSNVAHGYLGGEIEVVQLTNSGSNRYPCMSDGFVTWVGTHEVNQEEIWIAGLSGVTASPTKLTDNGGQKMYPSSHGREKIVWMGREGDGYNWEIFVYDLASVPRYRQFTDDNIYDWYPVLAGAGDFAWIHAAEVRYFNASSHETISLTEECCPGDTYSNYDVEADAGTVVWRTYERGTQDPHRIFMWSGWREDITNDLGVSAHSFSMDDRKIAFGWGAQPERVRYWDGTTVHDLGLGAHPSLDDGWIAFEAWDGHDWEIYIWDGVDIIQVTDNDFLDREPSLSGNRVAWMARPDGPASHDQIFYAKLPGR